MQENQKIADLRWNADSELWDAFYSESPINLKRKLYN